MGSNPGSGRKCPRLRWDPWARHRTPDCSPGAAMSAAHCTGCVCALGWVKYREHISLLIILCIIVYVTNKAHLSLICNLFVGHVPKPYKLVVIKPLIKKLISSELSNYGHISNLPFMSKKRSVCSIVLSCKKKHMKNFSQVSGPAIAQKLHLLKLQMTCFLRQTKAASHW